MRNSLRNIAFVALAIVSFQSWADTIPSDTVYFYKSWEQMLDFAPEAVIIDPMIEAYSPYELDLYTIDEELNESMYQDYIAASIGDSIWLVSSYYLKENFKGDVKKLNGYIPVFFNDKMAFVTYAGSQSYSVSVGDFLFGSSEIDGEQTYRPDYYYIDFMNHQVLKVDHRVLSSLLEDYHDLLMRYEGMKDYKKDYIIEDYFFKFIDRASEDIMRPYILDLVGNDATSINYRE